MRSDRDIPTYKILDAQIERDIGTMLAALVIAERAISCLMTKANPVADRVQAIHDAETLTLPAVREAIAKGKGLL